ncbi:MAG: mannose-1-phosphate guanylyltransferase [Calditrichaeota bacterium]|nr:MAG: mannose-1-phosphate guanylyltransferase [Calditrichota bacterium]
MNVYAVLMAGGVGTRFWPRSRSRRPKQVLNILGRETMIQATYARIQGLVDPENVLVVTNREQLDVLRAQLPALPESAYLAEPIGRNTAPCIGLAAIHVLARDPEGIMLVLPADHLISDVAEFHHVMRIATRFVSEHDGLLTLGIEPSEPATGYGYIQRGEAVASLNGHTVYRVKTFAEKPNYETACRFLESGDFYWNSGMFIWKARTILKEIQEKLPEIYHGLEKVRNALGTSAYASAVEDMYRRIRGISIDFGVMQTAREVYVIPTNMGWSDVGSWDAVYEISPKDKQKIAGEFRDIVTVNGSESYIYAPGKVVALVGARNLIVVDTEDALLICKRNAAQDVKEAVEKLKKKGLDDVL